MGLTWKDDGTSIEEVPSGMPVGRAFRSGTARLWLHDPPDGWLDAVTEAVGKPTMYPTPDRYNDVPVWWACPNQAAALDLVERACDAVQALRQPGPEPDPATRPDPTPALDRLRDLLGAMMTGDPEPNGARLVGMLAALDDADPLGSNVAASMEREDEYAEAYDVMCHVLHALEGDDA